MFGASPNNPQEVGREPQLTPSLRSWLPWFAAAAFALLAGFVLAAYFALQTEVIVLRDQAELAEIQGKTLRQQIEAGQILSARRLADLRSEIDGSRNLDRLLVISLTGTADATARSTAVAVLDPDRQAGELIVSLLPAQEPDKTYQLWLFDSEHPGGVSLAVFSVDSAAAGVRVPFKLNPSRINNSCFRISLEHKGGASVPGGPVVLASR